MQTKNQILCVSFRIGETPSNMNGARYNYNYVIVEKEKFEELQETEKRKGFALRPDNSFLKNMYEFAGGTLRESFLHDADMANCEMGCREKPETPVKFHKIINGK